MSVAIGDQARTSNAGHRGRVLVGAQLAPRHRWCSLQPTALCVAWHDRIAPGGAGLRQTGGESYWRVSSNTPSATRATHDG